MKRIKNIFLVLFISPEFLILISILAVADLYPAVLESVGDRIKADSEIWKYLPTLTLAFSAMAFRLSSKLRAPLDNTSNKALYDWPLYPLLVDRVIVSLLFSVVAGVAALILWVYGDDFTSLQIGAIFLCSTIAAATTALSMLFAHQTLKELLDKHG